MTDLTPTGPAQPCTVGHPCCEHAAQARRATTPVLDADSTPTQVLARCGDIFGILPRHIEAITAELLGRFLLIPRTQLETGTIEYLVPREFDDDSPAVTAYHAHQLHNAIAASVAEGLLIVTPPVLEEADEATRRAHHRAFIEDARLFRLTATGWRHPTPTGDTP